MHKLKILVGGGNLNFVDQLGKPQKGGTNFWNFIGQKQKGVTQFFNQI